MKKFIITFNHKGFTFSAKVFIFKEGNTIVYSTQLIEDCLGYMFENKELVFTKEATGYNLMLFSGATKRTPQSFKQLHWHIKTEYMDKTQSLHKQTFSLS